MGQWFVVREGREQGPISDQQLRELASKGQVQPTHRIRRADMQKPVMAAKVQGLVFGNIAVKTAPAVAPAQVSLSPSQPVEVQPAQPTPKKRNILKEWAMAGSVIFVVLAVMVAITESDRGKRPTRKRASANPTPTTPPAKPTASGLDAVPDSEFLIVEKVYGDYHANEIGAEQTYKGKPVLLVGHVSKVSQEKGWQNPLAGTVVDLKTRRDDRAVRCVLSKKVATSAAVAAIRPDDFVKVRGTCQGKAFGMWVYMTDCEILVTDQWKFGQK